MKGRKFLEPPPLTPLRMALALGLAMVADGLQMALGPLGWVGAVQVIDVVAAIATFCILGFHILLLPTFVVELFPIVDMLPTWTGCVAAVIALRKRESRIESAKDVTPAKSEIKDATKKEQDVS
ncbi:MAG TPA: hypothetical protein PKA41_20210 [Verrucomicrobiota bacterium]|nr:hypothetical protein [Verrucomicrobiota bacterium]